jgi:hypothetical protein
MHILEIIALPILVWLAYAGIALGSSAPMIIVGRHRVHWHRWELLSVVTPLFAWTLLSGLGGVPKSLSNVVLELPLIALATPFAAAARVVIGKQADERLCAITLIVALTAFAAVVYWQFPTLPE